MSSTSPLDDVIDYLIQIFGAATELPAKDGPDNFDDSALDMLLVGVRLNEADDDVVGEITLEQTFPYVGPRYKEERAEIPCSILLWTGDHEVRPRRSAALDYWSRCEAAHRADLSLGDLVEDSAMNDSTRITFMPTERGNLCVLTFSVAYRARLQPHGGA